MYWVHIMCKALYYVLNQADWAPVHRDLSVREERQKNHKNKHMLPKFEKYYKSCYKGISGKANLDWVVREQPSKEMPVEN